MPESHIVQPGECMLTIAGLHGYVDWRALYYHPDNAALRSRCPDPFVLPPGEEVVLPAKRPLERRCRTGRRHVFRLAPATPTWTLRLQLEDEGGRPRANAAYRLSVAGEGRERRGTTSSHGWLEQPGMPIDAMWGELELWPTDTHDGAPSCTWTLEFGGLDPASTTAGRADRLVNLGYLAPHDRLDEAQIAEAEAEFRRDRGLDEGASIDAELARVHGS